MDRCVIRTTGHVEPIDCRISYWEAARIISSHDLMCVKLPDRRVMLCDAGALRPSTVMRGIRSFDIVWHATRPRNPTATTIAADSHVGDVLGDVVIVMAQDLA